MFDDLQQHLNKLEQQQRLRSSRAIKTVGHQAFDPTQSANTAMLNLSSNDYLGLAGDALLQARFFDQADLNTRNWMSASSSRALTGTTPKHMELEQLIAASYQKQACLLFNSGYHANTGILPAITDQRDLIIADKLVHASIIDGLKLGGADFKRYAHNKLDHLASLLTRYREHYRRVWIVTESLFSMDGDYAPLAELVDIKHKYQALLYVDEAHAVGCIGSTGLGYAETLGLIPEIDILVGTFGKALAGYGGFAVADRVLIDNLINGSRPWLFSTALPPINIAWNMFIWQQLDNFAPHRQKLSALTEQFQQGLADIRQQYLGNSHIVPILYPGNREATELANGLQQNGILALPIRYPTVANGSERIRFSISANLSGDHIKQCLQTVSKLVEAEN